ncbi:MAG: membrane protein [Acidimicrobiales bacterium]|nr:MAG: membrane protein [Acidimicrobiales bacterium]
MGSPESWQWLWLVAAAAFLAGEMFTPGSFYLLPFAGGAAVAALLAFVGASTALQWAGFVVVSIAAFFSLRPLARKLDAELPAEGVGAKRLIGELGKVVQPIPPGPDGVGRVRVESEEWRATSSDGSAIDVDTPVRVLDVRGTRLVVHPITQLDGRS